MNESLLNRILKDHKRRTRSLALILCLSMIVSLGTFAGFHKNAIAKVYTREVLDCPYAREGAEPVAHVHNDDCYEGETLVCTLPEREAHTHDDTCYAESRMLSCGLEENPGHQHSEACYDEEGQLICQIPEGEGAHVHTDACYTIERALVCNQPELPVHVHDAGCFRTEEITVDEPEETAASEQAVSTVPEMPVSDPNADLETVEDWNREFENLELSGNWARDLVLVAATQQGRGESPNNFEAVLNDAGDAWVRHGYTRYGAWYGYPYAEWDAMFVSFCLRYAGIPVENVPNNPTAAFMAESFSMGGLFAGRDYVPAVGDLIFFDTVDDEITNIDHMGIVYHVDAENGTINTVEGDRTDAVATFGYYLNDEQIVGYGILPQNPNYVPNEGENTDIPDEAFDGFIFMTTDEEEEKQEETTTAEDVTAAAVPMPAQSWERTAGGIKVSVEAPEGAFPENTKIAVTPVNGSSLKDTVSDAVDGEVLEVQAVDITFFDAEGREIEPAVPIRVVMTPAATQHAEEKTSVVHVDVTQQTAELIEQAEGTETDNSEVVFDAEAFTIYAIVYTVDFEYGVNGKTFTSSMPGAEDMPLSEIVKGLSIVDEEELETFLSKIASVTSTNEEVAVVTEDRSVRVLKDGDAQIVITMQDGAAFSIDVSAEGVTEISDENEVATVSTVNDLYLPAAGEVKAELLTEEKSENAIAAVQTATESEENSTAAESASYQAFSIALENVDVTAYDGFNVAVALPEDVVVGRDFQLYQVKEDGTATDLTESLTVTGEPNEDGLQNVSGISFTTEDFADFVLSYSIETFYTTAGGDTYRITLNYGPKAGIPDGAALKVSEILPEDEKYTEYYTKAVQAVSGMDEAVQLTEDSYARFFDIEIWAEEEKVEPKAEVSVSITLQDTSVENSADLNVVHFGEGDPEVLKSETAVNEENGTTELAFVTYSFSVYGVITVPAPSSVNDLNGYSVKISNLGYYLGAENITVGGSRRLSKTNIESEAPVWTFEAAGTAGQYNIYTETEEGKRYINIKRATERRGDVILSSEPQALTVVRNGNSYRIHGTDNGGTYYLNQFDGTGGSGFAGWYWSDASEAQLGFTFVPSISTNNKDYMVVVKQGDAYYVVLNDGTLSPAEYNPSDNTVKVEDPMMWKYDGQRLYHVTREAGFTTDDIASANYYRYIDPNSPNGLNEDNEDNTARRGTSGVNQNGINGVVIDSRDLWDSVKFTYTGHKLQSVSHPEYYIGVDGQAQLRLKGQVSVGEAVEIFLADPLVTGSDWQKHTVNHIDISINGTAEVDVPLAYGKYYDKNGNVVKEVPQNKFEKLHLTRAQVVDPDELTITPADMKRSTISASCNGVNLDNAFYITGYSGNAEHAEHGGEGDYVTSPQVRIEGSFLVAKMPADHAELDMSKYDSDQTYRSTIRSEHLANRVEYSVSVVKSVQFYLQMPVLDGDGNQIKDGAGNPVYQQLYDANGEPLKIRADLAFSDSFDYWDRENECPVFTDRDRWYYYKNYRPENPIGWNEDSREDGDVARCGFSGMDFKLGGSGSQSATRVYAIEITKIVVDEQGNRIKSDNIGTADFSIYRKVVETTPTVVGSDGNEYLDVVKSSADEVKDLDIGSFSEAPYASDPNYIFLRNKTIQVGSEGIGLVYDYDVTPALYYVEEDPDSVKESITDTSGKEWAYKETYIWTEYAWRNHSNDNYMHVGQTYTEAPAEGGYKSVPEILGNHYGYNGTDGPYTNDFLEFYVYNVYESPKVDVPVIKTWADFEGNEYDWTASFKLQWAPLYPDETKPSVSFQDVTPTQTMTINKSDMAGITPELINRYLSGNDTLTAEETARIEAVTFKNLPKYGTDSNGTTFRYQYSLEETSYRVINASTGVLLYAWDEENGYSGSDPDTHYMPFYPHDAGEAISGQSAELNEADANYYVDVRNQKKNVNEKKYINVSLDKQWDNTFDERNDSYWAEFELRRFVHTEYRDLSHMSDADMTADPITITIKNGDTVVDTLQVQPNVGLYLGGNFKPHDSAKSVIFTSDHSVRLPNDSRVSTLSAAAGGSNMSNALVRTTEFFVTQNTVFTITEGAENLVAGNLAKVLDTGVGTPPLPDRSYSQTIRLDSSNGWHVNLDDLLRSATSAGDDDDHENVTFYEYYLVEKDSNPKGYAQYFRADVEGNVTAILSGDSDHQIEHDDSIVAVNGPSNRLIVKKMWRGAPITTGFPGITFTLYQSKDQNGNDKQIFKDENGTEYKNIELKGNNLEWICPVMLPATYTTGDGVSHNYYYYVQEDQQNGSYTEGEGSNAITAAWEYYYYLSSHLDENGNEITHQTNAYNQGNQVALIGSDVNRSGGTITICNKMTQYTDLDIKKQFFTLLPAGSWLNSTSDITKDVVLGFKVIRAIKTSDGKYLDEQGHESDKPVWMDYSDEMLCGYDSNGQPVLDNGGNEYYLKYMGLWHFEIMNNWGDQTNINAADSGSSLPTYGFYIRNGEDIVVEYEYSFRETNVYKNLARDPYPEWDWFSSITPVNGYGPGKTAFEAFPKVFHGQDPERIANFQASDLIIDKEWIGDPAASAVYVKIWRTSGNGEPEDFTAIIAEDVRNNHNWQMYLSDPSGIDLYRNCLILKPDSDGKWENAIKVNRALLGALSETGEYHYYIQEVGYRTAGGEYRTNVNGTFKPLYDKWTGTATEGAYTGAPVGMNDYAGNNIKIGAKGENRLEVINSTEPSTSYTVTKAFHGPQSSTGGQSSVTGKYPTDGSKQVVVELQQRYRYEKTEGGIEYVSADHENWVRADSAEAATTWTVDWQGAESASPTSVVLPLDKPEGSILSDEAWYGSAAAWTYTWEGLDVKKVVSQDSNPVNSKIAQLYYRAVEVSTPDWFNSVIAAEEQNGHKAIDDSNQTVAGVLSEKNTVTNERNDCNLELNKEWTGLGEGKTWPDGYTIDYQLIQHFHLALADMSDVSEGHIVPSYSTGKIFKSVEMTTTNSGATTADSVHPQATGIDVGAPTDGTTVIARITGLPVYGFLTATAEDVSEAAEHGVTLTAGTVYPVVYTYSAKETAVKKNGTPVPFKEQTVDAEENQAGSEGTGEGGTTSETENNVKSYVATFTNEFTSVTVEKRWNGMELTSAESATIKLYRFAKDIEPEPETTFQYTVNVTGTDEALNSSGTVTAVIYDENDTEVESYKLKKNDWSHDFTLEKGGTYHATFTADGTVLESVSPESASGITEAGSIDLTAAVKPVASGSVKVVVNGSPSNLYMNPLQDSNGELNPQKKFSAYFNGSGGETETLDGLMPGTTYRFQIGAAPTSIEGGTYNGGFVSFTAVDGLHTITLNYSSGGGGDSNITSGSFTGANNYWGINDWNALNVGQTYSFIFQVDSDPSLFTVDATGVTSCSYSVTNNWNSGGQITVTFVPASADEVVSIVATNIASARRLQTRSLAMPKVMSAPPLRESASITWTNSTTGLPAGADPTKDTVIETVTFSGTTWSKTWDELPKYFYDETAEKTREYVYYAYETAYTGVSGATALETTYSVDENGKLIVTNTPTLPDLGNLKVEKEQFYNGTLNATANVRSFTVGIFTDAEGKIRVEGTKNQTINIANGKGETTFSGLPAGTYYVFEIVDNSPVTTSGTKAVINGFDYTVSYEGNPATTVNGETVTAKVKNDQIPFDLDILKVDEKDNTKTLDGAEFKLHKLEYNTETGKVSYVADSEKTVTTSNGGKASFEDLDLGYYEIIETKAPAGYIMTGSSTFYIKVADSGIQMVTYVDSTPPDEWGTTESSGSVTFTAAKAKTDTDQATNALATVPNTPGTALPQTGGIGTTLFTALGSLMTATAGAILTIRRKRKPAEG